MSWTPRGGGGFPCRDSGRDFTDIGGTVRNRRHGAEIELGRDVLAGIDRRDHPRAALAGLTDQNRRFDGAAIEAVLRPFLVENRLGRFHGVDLGDIRRDVEQRLLPVAGPGST